MSNSFRHAGNPRRQIVESSDERLLNSPRINELAKRSPSDPWRQFWGRLVSHRAIR
jgi:hypothetical protein